jgi:hypothetical protein
MKEQTCQKDLYVYVFASLRQYTEKNNKNCLETFVNNLWLLEKS